MATPLATSTGRSGSEPSGDGERNTGDSIGDEHDKNAMHTTNASQHERGGGWRRFGERLLAAVGVSGVHTLLPGGRSIAAPGECGYLPVPLNELNEQ